MRTVHLLNTGQERYRCINLLSYSAIRGRKWEEGGRNYIMRSFIICTPQILLWWSHKGQNRRGISHGWRKGEMHTKFLLEILEGSKPFSVLSWRWDDSIRRMDLKLEGCVLADVIWFIGSDWVSVECGCKQCPFWFHKRQEIYWYNVSETGFCLRLQVKLSWAQSIELVPIFGPEEGDIIQSPKRCVLK
jgi:hypothetical protein